MYSSLLYLYSLIEKNKCNKIGKKIEKIEIIETIIFIVIKFFLTRYSPHKPQYKLPALSLFSN